MKIFCNHTIDNIHYSVNFSGKVNSKKQEEKFIRLRDEIIERDKTISYKKRTALWFFYKNSTDSNQKKLNEMEDQLCDFYGDPKILRRLKAIKKGALRGNKELKRQLEKLIDVFSEIKDCKDETDEIEKMKYSISKKSTSFQMKIDGKPVSGTEISDILACEKNIKIRKKAEKAKISLGDFISKDLIKLVKMRNALARKCGYKNFFEMELIEKYDIAPRTLYKLLKDVEKKTRVTNEIVFENIKERMAKAFGIKKEDVRSYHYGYDTDEDPEFAADHSIRRREDVVKIVKRAYKKMGYDVDKLPIKLDLFSRKNKNPGAMNVNVAYGEDSRVLANVKSDVRSIRTLMHEIGHAIYTVKISPDVFYYDRGETSTMTEAVAMMMGDLPATEEFFKHKLSKKENEKFSKSAVENDSLLLTYMLQLIEFEKGMYENPNQDLKKLWHDMGVKYFGGIQKDELTNEWATIPHFVTHPNYCQNYFRALLIKAQLYETLTKKFGKLTRNPESAKFLNENLFRYGGSKSDEELIKSITGKPLSADALCRKFNAMA